MSVPPVVPTRPDTAIAASTPTGRPRRRVGPAVTVLAVLVFVFGLFAGLAPGASAAGVDINQCNGVYNADAEGLTCTVDIVNQLNLDTGESSSVVTTEACHGAPGAALTCPPTITHQLPTSVTQCNGSGNKGGSFVTCTVTVENTIIGSGTSAPATVNQCIESGQGGGARVVCNPLGETSGATVTQCNGSGNGGGGGTDAVATVTCTVTPSTTSAALPVTINQCVGSGNGGGGTVVCTSTITTKFIKAPPTTTPSSASASSTSASSTATGPTRSRPRPTGSVRPSTTVRPTSSTTAGRSSSSVSSGSHRTTSGGAIGTTVSRSGHSNNAGSTSTHSTSSYTAAANGAGTTSSSGTSTTALASTGVPANRQGLLALALLMGGATLMVLGRRPRWIGKHR